MYISLVIIYVPIKLFLHLKKLNGTHPGVHRQKISTDSLIIIIIIMISQMIILCMPMLYFTYKLHQVNDSNVPSL